MKITKKFLLSLLGIPVASLIILIIYFFIYTFLGNQFYIYQIEQIKDISILLKEFCVLSFSIYIAFFSYLVSIDIINDVKYKILTKVLAFILLILGFAILPILLVKIFFSSSPIFNISFLVLWVTIVASISLIYIIKDFINVWIINKNLKEN